VYQVFKLLHLAGVVLLIGNVTVTAYWKVLVDREGTRDAIALAQRGVIVADWLFTVSGIVLLTVGGYGMAILAGMDLTTPFLLWGQVLFAASGLIWLGVLIPLQIRLAHAARTLPGDPKLDASYAADSRSWLVWGIAATVPLVAAMYVMIVK
jgi:uncharacterized membrane protein